MKKITDMTNRQIRASLGALLSTLLVAGLCAAFPVAAREAAQGSAALAGPIQQKMSPASRQLQRLLKSDWEWRMREFPEWATFVGDHRQDHRLTDISAQAIEKRHLYRQRLQRALSAISDAGLPEADRLSREILLWSLERELEGTAFFKGESFAEHWGEINPQQPFHLGFSQLKQVMPFNRTLDYRNYLSRLAALPAQIDQVIVHVRAAAAKGWSVPQVTLARIPGQIDRVLGPSLEEGSWYAPMTTMPAGIAATDQDALRAQARQILETAVLPALARLRRFAADEYPKLARSSIGASELPGGAAYYEHAIKDMTTLALPAKDIHQTGLNEVARIKAEMQVIARQVGFGGAMEEFPAWARQQPGAFYSTPEELLAGYRAIGKQADAASPSLFAELPRTPWGVRAAALEEQGNADHYIGAPGDGSRAGYFVADVSRPDSRPRWEMTALLLHEAVPGHHLQIARAAELKSLPKFRQHAWFVGYGEGWALYAESLGEEMGLYKDPMTRYGRLTYEIFRAARLVVDTGIHAFGWPRDQAISYMLQATGMDRQSIEAEVDRYIVWPGQALGYKLGELKIKELRGRASRALGERFDLRAFHNLIIDSGPVPLAVLERQVERWIAASTKAAKGAPVALMVHR